MIKITSRWFPQSPYGRVMAFDQAKFSFRPCTGTGKFMSYLLGAGCTWQQVFFARAGTVRFAPDQPGLSQGDPADSPASRSLRLVPTADRLGKQGCYPVPAGVWVLLAPLFRCPVFWYVCMFSIGLTLLREAFNT